MRPGTRPTGAANRRGRRRRWWARSRAGQAAGAGRPGRRLGRQPQSREEPPHRMGFGHRAEDPPPAPAAIAHQHIKAEHPLE
jgi:hypothetical protein